MVLGADQSNFTWATPVMMGVQVAMDRIERANELLADLQMKIDNDDYIQDIGNALDAARGDLETVDHIAHIVHHKKLKKAAKKAKAPA